MSYHKLKSLVLCACLLSQAAFAATTLDCTLQTNPLNFGGYNPFSVNATKISNAVIVISCTGNIPKTNYTIALSPGSSGTYSARKLSNGRSSLTYNIYTSSAYNQIWGNGTGGSVIVSATVQGYNYSKSYYAFGQISAKQTSATPGTYTDTIIYTITY
jgi:spore coat protein U-like protein